MCRVSGVLFVMMVCRVYHLNIHLGQNKICDLGNKTVMGNSQFFTGTALAFFLVAVGFLAGSYGTLIGIGGAVILTPVLLILYPDARPEALTSITMAKINRPQNSSMPNPIPSPILPQPQP